MEMHKSLDPTTPTPVTLTSQPATPLVPMMKTTLPYYGLAPTTQGVFDASALQKSLITKVKGGMLLPNGGIKVDRNKFSPY